MRAAARLIPALKARSLTIATAESLTGGLVCAALTEVPGSSAVVRGAVVAYATDLKGALLGVDEAVLASGGAVQAEVARQMAVGVCRLLGTTVGIATTGVAGPDAQDGQPVGTVFVAVARPEDVRVLALQLEGSRDAIRRDTVSAALGLATSLVTGETGPVDLDHPAREPAREDDDPASG